MSDQTSLKVTDGTSLGRYTILELVGSGAMGVVYQARDERLERIVAIKVLTPGVLTGDESRRRFRKEALALAKLNHAHIAAVYDVGEQDGIDYLVMELVQHPSCCGWPVAAFRTTPVTFTAGSAPVCGGSVAFAASCPHITGAATVTSPVTKNTPRNRRMQAEPQRFFICWQHPWDSRLTVTLSTCKKQPFGRFIGIHSPPELLVLLISQVQEHPAPAHGNRLVQHQTALLVREFPTDMPRELPTDGPRGTLYGCVYTWPA